MSEQRNNANIRGEAMPIDDLLYLMGVDDNTIDIADIESALEWWDVHASPEFIGALEAEPSDNTTS